MKKTILRVLSVFLALVLLAPAVFASGASSVLELTQPLSEGTTLVHGTWRLGSGSRQTYLQENYLLYEEDSDVLPMVVFGDTLYGRSDMKYMSEYLEKNDLSMVAAVNAAFFDMDTGIPYGLVVTDGVLRSGGSANAVGFFSDGSAIIGDPELKVEFEDERGNVSELLYNKTLTKTNGFCLYSPDYDSKTKNSLAAYNVVLRPTGGKAELSMNCQVEVEVTGMVADTASCAIQDDCFVLSLAEKTSYETAYSQIESLQIGDTLTIRTSCARAWRSVDSACGGGDLLVENGEACESFTLDSKNESRARTAVGLKEDGTLVLYTVDESKTSSGLMLSELAGRLSELGCVTALNLDGGGSTAMGVQYPGYTSGATANSPSDGSLRSCANYIFLARKQRTARSAERLFLYPCDGTPVLPGGQLTLTVKATDAYYMASDVPEDVEFSVRGGEISEKGVLTVDEDADTVTVTAQSRAGEVRVKYTVLDEISSISVTNRETKKPVEKLHLAGGSTLDLSASAVYCGMNISAQNSSFRWSVPEKIGSVVNGTLKTARVTSPVEGNLVVSFGDTGVTIPVTVSPENPFEDVKGHWAASYINSLYFEGTLTGSAGKDGKLLYRPDDSMTRQEFVVALMRYLGTDLSKYGSVKLPFEDTAKIASWAESAMKAAYELGYMGGSKSGDKLYAKPTDTITRQEAMVILARTKDLTEASKNSILSQFSDSAKVADWAAGPLSAMVEKGVIGGSNGKLNPTGNVSRAEVAKMLYSMANVK